MASPPPSSSIGAEPPKTKPRGSLFRNAMKRKHQFIQFFAMSGILLLSMRSLGQKYRIHDLLQDTAALQDEHSSLVNRMDHIKSSLRHEASLDSSGIFASRLRQLFGDDHMDPERCPDICIMLVDPDPRSSQNTLALLVNSNYRVVTAFQGADALELLKKKKRRVDLVLMPTELPDMCTLEVLDILKSKYNMAVVMLVDTDQPSAKEEFLWNGAMFCYKKPLDSMSAATLWQHAFVKEAELFSQSLRPPRSGVTINDFGKIHVAKRKFEGSSSFTWTPYIENIFLGIVHNLGVYDADPLEVLNRMHVPGLTLDEVTDKLQEYQARQNNPDYPPIPMRIIDLNAGNQLMGQNIYANPGQAFAHEQGILQNPRQDQLNRARAYEIPAPPLALVTSVPFVPHVPNMPQLPQASVPPANTAQMLIVPPWPPAPTYLPSSSVAPPAPGHGEDDGKLGG